MDVQLKELIEKIKLEGVKTAEEQASEIIREAEGKAAQILAQAEKDSIEFKEKAKNEAAQFEMSGKEALKQAGRDLILGTRKQLEKLFGKVLENETEKVLKDGFLETSIATLIKNWKDDLTDMSVLLPENLLEQLEAGIRKKVGDKLRGGLEIKPVRGIKSGFRISAKDGSAYYDFTAAGIAGILSGLLNPRVALLLKETTSEEA